MATPDGVAKKLNLAFFRDSGASPDPDPGFIGVTAFCKTIKPTWRKQGCWAGNPPWNG
jgi:hypothetical protein